MESEMPQIGEFLEASSLLVKSVDEAAGIGQDCRFPFRAVPDPSKEHG
jgi:hypothetical protein